MTRHRSSGGPRLRVLWQRHVGNRIGRTLLALGLAPRVYALLETTGNRSGLPRRTPVGNGLVPGTAIFWLVAEYGRRAAYVRNIEADPRVRVKIGRRWRTGTARLLPDDDARARQRGMNGFNAAAVRFFADDQRELLTVRIDLDPR